MSDPEYTARLLEEAAAEIRDAVRWYRQVSPGKEREFLAAVKATLGSIRQNPYTYPQVLGSARRALLRKFPYALYFTVFGHNILVLACYHSKRNPSILADRL